MPAKPKEPELPPATDPATAAAPAPSDSSIGHPPIVDSDTPPAPFEAFYSVNGQRIPVALRTEDDGTITILREGAPIVIEAEESPTPREGYFTRAQ